MQDLSLTNLRVEMLVNPEGIDVPNPRFSWEILSDQRNIKQTAYHILVASTPEILASGEGDLWNSGIVKSGQSIHILYTGNPLQSRTRCYWKVRIWSGKAESGWSEPAYWSMGLLYYNDWRGNWIGFDRAFPWDSEEMFSRLSARYFRKEFSTGEKQIKSATVYISGLGLYELYLNGYKIGHQVLAPSPTDYTKNVKYNTFDVTNQMLAGTNTIGTILGNGRYYTMRQNYKPYKIKTFGYPKLLLNLVIEYTDGTIDIIATDDSWKGTADGPVRMNNEYDGEEYDARKEMPGWNMNGYDDSQWLGAEYVQEPRGELESQMNENMQVMESIRPVSVIVRKPGVFILDMGENMVGWISMKVKGNRGDREQLRFAETLTEDGDLFLANLRDARVTDIYILKGEGEEIWEPGFVYHGFRYVEITGYPGIPSADNFTGKIVYDNIKTTGSFETSNETINQIYRNAFRGIRGNYKGMPVDCPQRNERQPWLGDRAIGSLGESFIFDNGRLYAKWLDDIHYAQKADGSIPDVAPAFWRYYTDNMTWPGTYILIAGMLYNQYGDILPIRKHYESMKKWLEYMQEKYMKDFIVTKDEYGDWCVPPESKELIHTRDPFRQTDGQLIATAYYYHFLQLMKKFALLTDRSEDVADYSSLAENIKNAFNARFLTQDGYYDNNTVTANILPLCFDIVPENQKESIFQHIINKILIENDGHISTGLIGTQWLMRGLSRHGRADVAYRLATNRDYPGWGYMVENGATTIWELWNGNTADPEMNSHNHVMLLGDLVAWFYEDLAGIKSDPELTGFRRILMHPEFVEELHYVRASYHSISGPIVSEWEKKGNRLEWNITIPPNTTAVVHLPATSVKDIMESGIPVTGVRDIKVIHKESANVVLEIGSGTYVFNTDILQRKPD